MKNLKAVVILSLFTLTTTSVYAQNCDCTQNFEWVKTTFETNDAGFEYALKQKGKQAYEDHNKRMAEKVKAAKTFTECGPVLYDWLTFFPFRTYCHKTCEERADTASIQPEI